MVHLNIKGREAVSKKMKPSSFFVSKPVEGCLSDSYVKDLSPKFIYINTQKYVALEAPLFPRWQEAEAIVAERTMHT